MIRQDLIDAYSSPARHYHNLRHIEDCLGQLSTVEGLSAEERQILQDAIWWHDAVYDAARNDNEERSAGLAERNVPEHRRAEVCRLIHLTKSHRVEAGDRLGSIMISIDLSILGAEPAIYKDYAAAIRREYAHVPDEAYRAGRAAVLKRFIAMQEIFPYAPFAERYDRRARDNLMSELATLEPIDARPR